MKRPDSEIYALDRAIRYVKKFGEAFTVLTNKEAEEIDKWIKHLEAENASLKKELEELRKVADDVVGWFILYETTPPNRMINTIQHYKGSE